MGSTNPFLIAIVGALLAMSFAGINGYAIGFIDTRSYIRGAGLATKFATGRDFVAGWKAIAPSAPANGAPSDQTKPPAFSNNGITANRSIYYGFLLLVGYLSSSFWLTVFVQGYVIATLIAIVIRRCAPVVSVAVYLGTMLGLTLLTGLGPYIAYLMPDIFTGAMIIAVALVATLWRAVARGERLFCLAVLACALLFHPSNEVILLGLVAAVTVWHLARGTLGRHRTYYLAIAACFAVGVAGQQLFSYGLQRATGSRPLTLPHLTAHLVDMGPGYRYIRASCPQSGWAVCRFEDRLPIYWEDFVGLADPRRGVFAPADLPTKRALSAEQIPFALSVLRFDPVGVVTGLARDAARQLVAFSPTGLRYVPGEMTYFAQSFPTDVDEHIARSRLGRGNGLLAAANVANLVLVCGGLVVIVAFGVRLTRATGHPQVPALAGFVAVLSGGFVMNALVCGIFASPLDRYGGRVVWIIPLASVIITLWQWERRRSRHDELGVQVADFATPFPLAGETR